MSIFRGKPGTQAIGQRRRPRLSDTPTARRRHHRLRLMHRGPPSLVKAEQDVVDDFPQVIPVTPRELDVIETFLDALLDDALKSGNSHRNSLGESPPRCDNAGRQQGVAT